jgi:signal transduction histidine kinase/ActR/RegA family two-component response regulator
VLLDHLRDFLVQLGEGLAESADPSTCQHRLAAVVHGEQRWDAGWSLAEVVRDYQILRLVIVDYLEETLARPLRHREVEAIGLALDEAITASVLSYVKERDEYLRGLAEQRAAADKQVQEQLREQAEALQEADRRKNEFIAMLAHELRNPLASIYTAIEIQRRKGSSDPELQWSSEVIERQVRHVSRLVDDLLDVSRTIQGKVKLQREAVDVATVVSRALEMARPFVDSRKHELHVTLPSEPAWLEADSDRLAQVLTNLLHNAAKFTKDGGQIWLKAEREDRQLVIKVRDSGIGIPADLLMRIFEPFTQEDRSLDRADGGLGLGLTLVRTLVELHGGNVKAFSGGRGRGSEFEVSLPLMREPPLHRGRAQGQPETRDRGPARRILVVDDNVDAAKTLALLLRIDGHDVSIAHDGPTALAAAFEAPPDVVLLDIGLPGMDGLEVARHLRMDPRLKGSLIVALSGYGQADIAARSEQAVFHAHLTKPLDPVALARLLSSDWQAP